MEVECQVLGCRKHAEVTEVLGERLCDRSFKADESLSSKAPHVKIFSTSVRNGKDGRIKIG